jgi:histidine triad (HIT) family protein/ATP adenylyltransferase
MTHPNAAGGAGGLPRRPMDAATYERRAREGPCFVCEVLAGNPRYPGETVWAGDDAVAFLASYNTLLGHTLVAPRVPPGAGDRRLRGRGVSGPAAARLPRRRGAPARAAHRTAPHHEPGQPVGNQHVHWHVAPLPPGVPYDEQQFAAFSWDRGVLDLPEAARAALARRIGARVAALQRDAPSVG